MAKLMLNRTLWKVVTGVTVVLGLIAGIWKFDDRYAKAEALEKTKKSLEVQTIQTFESFQMKQQTINDGLRLDLLNLEYKRAKEELYKLRKELKVNVGNVDIEQSIDEVKKLIDDISNKRSELRNKLMGIE